MISKTTILKIIKSVMIIFQSKNKRAIIILSGNYPATKYMNKKPTIKHNDCNRRIGNATGMS